MSIAQAALLTSGVALVTIVPSGPGYVGTFELTVVAIADGFGIPRDSAFALGLLVHVVILATTTIGGVIAMVALRRRRAAAADAAAAAETAETVDDARPIEPVASDLEPGPASEPAP